ncbi:MAG: transglutaminase domain-containing protein [Immundisolibacteraceae bacterium]|nr:transglutaminase domain-containing protein [Immundisolibacteraceae bacterium]
MEWLTEWSLGGFALAVVAHLTGSMGFQPLGIGLLLLIIVRLLIPIRPAPPTLGLGFILLAIGGLGGWFGLEEFAVPGSWPMVFKAFAGICLGGLAVFLWQFFARQPEQTNQPLQPITQNMLVMGLLLLLLTPLENLASSGVGLFGYSSMAFWIQMAGVLLAVIGFSSSRQSGRGLRWGLLLLPPLLIVPLIAQGLFLVRKPLMMAMWMMAPNFSGGNVGFTPLQYLDHQAFLKPSSKVVMRIRSDELPSPYLVGNRLTTFASKSLSWTARLDLSTALLIGSDRQERNRYQLEASHSADQAPSEWQMAVTSLRWDSLLFLPPQAGEVALDGEGLALNNNQVWDASFTEGVRHSWLVSAGGRQPGPPLDDALQLPELWDQPLQAHADLYAADQRRHVVANIRADFLDREYSLSVNMQQKKPFHDFLLNRRPAYCFWYATGAALSLRANQIPSRLVSGYYIHERISRDLWLVRESDAHSWVEWQDEQGYWHTFDPTPPSLDLFQQQFQGGFFSQWFHLFRERVNQFWDQFDLTEQVQNVAIIGGFLILVFLFVREYLRIRQVGKTVASSDEAKKWRKLWQRFLALSGLPDEPHWSAGHYLDVLPSSWSDGQTAAAVNFLQFYQSSRFRPSSADMAPGNQLLKEFRGQLKQKSQMQQKGDEKAG